MKNINYTNKSNSNYPIGDFLIRLKNAARGGRKNVDTNSSKLIKAVAKLLEKEGYLTNLTESKGTITVSLAIRKKSPILVDIKLVSKPGLRIYLSREELGAKKGPSFFIVSTTKGILTSKDALKQGLGGEVIAEIL